MWVTMQQAGVGNRPTSHYASCVHVAPHPSQRLRGAPGGVARPCSSNSSTCSSNMNSNSNISSNIKSSNNSNSNISSNIKSSNNSNSRLVRPAASHGHAIAGLLQWAQEVAASRHTDRFIRLSNAPQAFELPPTMRNSIMVRDCYRTALTRIEATKPPFGIVVTGTPGVGQNCFAVFLISYLASKRQKVLFRYGKRDMGIDTLVMLDFTHLDHIKVDCVTSLGNPALYMNYLEETDRNDNGWLIADGRPPRVEFSRRGRNIMLCPPEPESWAKYARPPGVSELWLPTWSETELKECAQQLYPAALPQLSERTLMFGGVPQPVLEDLTIDFRYIKDGIKHGLHKLQDAWDVFHAQVDPDTLKLRCWSAPEGMLLDLVVNEAMQGNISVNHDVWHGGCIAPVLSMCQLFKSQALKQIQAGIQNLQPTDFRCLPPPSTVSPVQPVAGTIVGVTDMLISELARVKELQWDDGQQLAGLDGVLVRPQIKSQGAWDAVLCSRKLGTVLIRPVRSHQDGLVSDSLLQLLQRADVTKPVIMLYVVPAEGSNDDVFYNLEGQLMIGAVRQQAIVDEQQLTTGTGTGTETETITGTSRSTGTGIGTGTGTTMKELQVLQDARRLDVAEDLSEQQAAGGSLPASVAASGEHTPHCYNTLPERMQSMQQLVVRVPFRSPPRIWPPIYRKVLSGAALRVELSSRENTLNELKEICKQQNISTGSFCRKREYVDALVNAGYKLERLIRHIPY